MAPEPALKNVVVADAGRGAWYDKHGSCIKEGALVVAIAGGSASGKSTVARELIRRLGVPWTCVVSQDSFYKSLTPEQSALAFENKHDFDSPAAFDTDVLAQCLAKLRAFRAVQIPVYSFAKHQRLKGKTQYLYGANLVILEGIFALADKEIRDLCDVKIFVQCDRIKRDLIERGRDVTGVIDQYLRFVKPSFDSFILPTARYADVIVPGANNDLAIDLIVSHIKRQLDSRNLELRAELSKMPPTPFASAPPTPGLSRTSSGFFSRPTHAPENVYVMPDTPQLRGVHTKLRDKTTSLEDFVFFLERLSTMLIETALGQLPYRRKEVKTSVGGTHEGAELAVESLCALTILRSGSCLEKGLRRVLSETPIGSALIQSHDVTGEPLLYYLSMPFCLRGEAEASKATVLILDSQIGTGAAALMAVRICLDHGVAEERILFVCFVASAKGGINALRRAFPKVRIITSALDPGLEQRTVPNAYDPSQRKTPDSDDGPVDLKRIWAITPGLGSIGARYFGC